MSLRQIIHHLEKALIALDFEHRNHVEREIKAALTLIRVLDIKLHNKEPIDR